MNSTNFMRPTKLSSNLSLRRQSILLIVEAKGYVKTSKLAEQFGVSMQTIRSDIIALAEAGKIIQVHGGAEAIGSERLEPDDYA